MTYTVWAPAPNRHLDPLWDEAISQGWVTRLCFGSAKLHWRQLGDPPKRHTDVEVCHVSHHDRSRIEAIVKESPGHIIQSIGHPLCLRVLAAAGRSGKSTVLLSESLQPRRTWSIRRVIRDALYRRALAGVTAIFALSPFAARSFSRLGAPASRIYPGIYAGPSAPKSSAKNDRCSVVFCGRLIRSKGTELIAGAVKQAAEALGSLRVEIVGDGPRTGVFADLERAGVPYVRHGVVSSEEVAHILSRCGVLVLPSQQYEGWGYVVNEALAAGIPSVVSGIASAKELIVPGRTGHVFSTHDQRSLAEGIVATLRLWDEEEVLKSALLKMSQSVAPGTVVTYMRAVLADCEAGRRATEQAPWLLAAQELGGNDDVEWWRTWLAGD